jgi:predicted permease
LLVRSLKSLKNLGPGFPAHHLITFAVEPGLNRYDGERAKAFYQRLCDNLRSIPGVQAAALATVPILGGDAWESPVTVEGYQGDPGQDKNPYLNAVSPGYFATMGIPVLEGRDFRMRDAAVIYHGEGAHSKQPAVVIVNEKFARHYFGGRSALGRHVGFGEDPGTPADMQIVGVIQDTKYTSLREEMPRLMFLPYMATADVSEMNGYVRTALTTRQVFAAVRNEIRKLDPDLPVFALRTMEANIDESLVAERLAATLGSVFSFLATLLASLGLYGVTAYTVERRTREIGLRMALGATRKHVMWLLMKEVLLLVTIGVAIALPIAWILSEYVKSQLHGLGPHDPATMSVSIAGIVLVACVAGYVPALRAMHVDPVKALCYE